MMWSVSLGLNNAVRSLKQSRFVFCSLSTKLSYVSAKIFLSGKYSQYYL